MRATRPKASLTARLFRRSKTNQSSLFRPCCSHTYSNFSSKAWSKTMCSEVQSNMLTHPESSRKTDNKSTHWASYFSQQEPAKSSSSTELRSNQTPLKLLLYSFLKNFLLPLLFCNWSQLAAWQTVLFSLCSQACLTVATATLANARVQRWCPVLLQGIIKCYTKWSLRVGRETYPDFSMWSPGASMLPQII